LFNGMINPIIGFNIRGVIWYQGEANLENYNEYESLFREMHKDWQRKWEIGNFPVYFVQIAPYLYKTEGRSPFIREQQMRTSQKQNNTGMVVTLDAGNGCIHPAKKRIVGERLSNLALAKTYGYNESPHLYPTFKSMTIKGDTAYLTFDCFSNRLTSYNRPLSLFQIAGNDSLFHQATARINGNQIMVSASDVKTPVAVRYAYYDDCQAELFSLEGLPASSFRTDNWDNILFPKP